MGVYSGRAVHPLLRPLPEKWHGRSRKEEVKKWSPLEEKKKKWSGGSQEAVGKVLAENVTPWNHPLLSI